MLKTSDLKIKILGITPVFKEKTGSLCAQEIAAFSALLTFKGKSVNTLVSETLKKGQKLEDKVKTLLLHSSLRGHASVATTPVISLTYEGSKFVDWALTGLYFSSSLVSSGRRTNTTVSDIVYPKNISRNAKAREIYKKAAQDNIELHNYFLSKGIGKDEARKILQQGIYGTGIIQLPVETIAGIKREYEAEKEWMPEEIGMLLSEIEKQAKDLGIDLLLATRQAAPRNVYPYPNIFKNPAQSNFARELAQKADLSGGADIASCDVLMTEGLNKKLKELASERKRIFASQKLIRKEWVSLIEKLQEIVRDYNSAVSFKILSRVPICIWTEKKRHRTCRQITESFYYIVERGFKLFKKYEKQIKSGNLSAGIDSEIEELFSIPPSFKKNKEYLNKYLQISLGAFLAYRKIIKLGIPAREAVFLIPRAVKTDILQEYDLYNLLTGYYPLRLCSTAEEEIHRNSWKEIVQIKNILNKKGASALSELIGSKCRIAGFCPEEKFCPLILSAVKDYNEKFHQEMKQDLENKFQKNFNNLGKI
jgi:thymidylate synthase ThyX